MPYTDVRDYIEELTRRNLLHVIEDDISKDTELVPLVRLQFRGLPEPERKAFWFKNVTDARGVDYDGSVLLGSLGSSRVIYGAALGVGPDEIALRPGGSCVHAAVDPTRLLSSFRRFDV